MASENDTNLWLEPDNSQYSGWKYKVFDIMEEILENLKRLNYEVLFCKVYEQQPLSKHYFVISTNSGEQFNYFIRLCSWLLQVCGMHQEMPEEKDDPNTVLSCILLSTKEIGINVEFGLNKLKSGHGPYCLWILHSISEKAVIIKNIKRAQPIYELEDFDSNEIELFEEELEEVITEMEEEASDADNYISINDLQLLSGGDQNDAVRPLQILESCTDTYAWNLEVERMLPQLNIQKPLHNKTWRHRLEEVKTQRFELGKKRDSCKSNLTRLTHDINNQLEKVNSREKYLESQMSVNLQDYKIAKAHLVTLKGDLRDRQFIINEMMQYMASVNSEVDQLKAYIDEKSINVSGGVMMSKIKEAIFNLRNECHRINLHLCLLDHSCLHRS